MNIKASLLLTLLFLQMIHSQHSDPKSEVQKLVTLGRDHIISLALKEIQKNEEQIITKDDFHFIQVMASNKRIQIHFGYNVIYLRKNSKYYTDITVEFPSKSISMSSENNDGDNTTFYRPTSEDLSAINFILNPNNTNNNILNKGKKWSLVIIYENENHYLVDNSARDPYLGGGFSKQEISKETGEVLSTLSGHYEPAPKIPGITDDNEEFIEISNK